MLWYKRKHSGRVAAGVPVVLTAVIDPIGAGLVESLARPGANMTGFTFFGFGTSAKWLELQTDCSPT
jgi:putative ABC transport system substrate-binding protein